MPQSAKGLEGVIAGKTAICTVGREGSDLRYRGYSISDIPEGTAFEEIAYLLLHGKLPTSAELAEFLTAIDDLTAIPPFVRAALESLPATTHPMDVLRTGVSLLGCAFPDDPEKPMATAYRLLATLPAMVR